MIKKLLLSLSLVSVLVLSGCGEEKSEVKPNTPEVVEPVDPGKPDFSFENQNLSKEENPFPKLYYSYYTSDSYLRPGCGNTSAKEFLEINQIPYEVVSEIKEETFRNNVEKNLFIFDKEGSFSFLTKSECNDNKELNYVDGKAYTIDELKEAFKDASLLKVNNSELVKAPFIEALSLVNEKLKNNISDKMHFIDQIYYSYFDSEETSLVLNPKVYEGKMISLEYYLDVLNIPYTSLEEYSEQDLMDNLENNILVFNTSDTRSLYGRDETYDQVNMLVYETNTNSDLTKQLYKVEFYDVFPDNLREELELDYDELIKKLDSDLFKTKLLVIDNSKSLLEEKLTIDKVMIPGFSKSEWEVDNTLYEKYHEWDSNLPLGMNDPEFDPLPCTKLAALYIYNYLHPMNQVEYSEVIKKEGWKGVAVNYFDLVNAGYIGPDSSNLKTKNMYDFKKAIDEGYLVSTAIGLDGMLNYTTSASDNDGIGYPGDRYDWINTFSDEVHEAICYGYTYIDEELYFMFYDPTEVEFLLPIEAFSDGTILYHEHYTWIVNSGQDVEILLTELGKEQAKNNK